MLFSSVVFLQYFLPLLVLLYFHVPKRYLPARNVVLLVFSLVFYGFGGVRYMGLLLLSILVNYLAGIGFGVLHSGKGRRAVLAAAVLLNLGLLGWFKYAGFAARTLHALGLSVPVPEIVLPIGISFYTFQGLSYVIDVYRGNASVQRNPLNVALYIALFPQLVAGPIVRYTDIEAALSEREHSLEQFVRGLMRFMIGFGKKMLLANAMGEVADAVFGLHGGSELAVTLSWLGALAYTFQIYFDFSGYSDMAIGLGLLFGFRFPENFAYPYIADSVTDFWRRWHISLSGWFRDYVYIPLGGSRCGTVRQIRNLFAVWVLTGLWHGADWTFVLWGFYYFLLLVSEKFLLAKPLSHVSAAVRRIGTFLLVLLGWVLFRADSIGEAFAYYRAMFGGAPFASGQSVYYLIEYLPEFLLCGAACLPFFPWIRKKLGSRFPLLRQAGGIAFAAAVFLLGYMKLIQGSFNPFIYFQF